MAARFALALVLTQIALLATTSSKLMASAGIGLRDIASEPFFLAGSIFACGSLALFFLLRFTARLAPSFLAVVIALAASVSLSHAASRMDHRPLLLVLTAMHHLGMAAWIGALPFLLIALKLSSDPAVSRSMGRRFSTMAIVGVAALILAGAGLSWFYAGSWQGMVGTSYGLLLSAKIVLTALILTLGAGNFFALRRVKHRPRAAALPPAPLQRNRDRPRLHGDPRRRLAHRAVSLGRRNPAGHPHRPSDRRAHGLALAQLPYARLLATRTAHPAQRRRARSNVHRRQRQRRQRPRLVGVQPPLGRTHRPRRRPARAYSRACRASNGRATGRCSSSASPFSSSCAPIPNAGPSARVPSGPASPRPTSSSIASMR